MPLEVMMAQLGHMDRETSLEYVHIQQHALERAKQLIDSEQQDVLAVAEGKPIPSQYARHEISQSMDSRFNSPVRRVSRLPRRSGRVLRGRVLGQHFLRGSMPRLLVSENTPPVSKPENTEEETRPQDPSQD